jgi:hypothetical protein
MALPAPPSQRASAPTLWNPNAAALWSLVFTPVFGAWLHMLNWQALGEPDEARRARRWVIGCLAWGLFNFFSGLIIPPGEAIDALMWLITLGVLLAWYYGHGKSQQRLLLGRYGGEYPRRAWTVPVLIGVGVSVALLALAFGLAWWLDPELLP